MTEPNVGGGGSVTFTTKELLAKLDEKLDQVLERLEQKVDMVAFRSLEARVQIIEAHGSPAAANLASDMTEMKNGLKEFARAFMTHADRISTLEASSKNNRWWISVLMGLLGAVIGVVGSKL